MRSRPTAPRRLVRRGRPKSRRPWLERMEERTLLTTFTVTSTGLGTGTTLDQAIAASNAAGPGPNLINFNIPTTDPGFNATTGIWTIAPTAALPTITTPVTIDGTTQQPGATHPVIEVNGAGAGAFPTEGFTVDAGATTIRGLAIDQFSNYAIDLENSGGDLVVGNVIGLDPTGTTALGNRSGVLVLSISNNTIGGTTAADRNIISGNAQDGVDVQGTGTLIQGNVVEGNYIGTDAAGTTPLGNGGAGVGIQAASDGTIGGTAAGAGNVIAANVGGEVRISIVTGSGQVASGNVVQGNLLGTNATGTVALSGDGTGVIVNDSTGNTIGGAVAAARNVIAGGFEGVVLSETAAGLGTGNLVAGNYIGTDATGTVALTTGVGVQVSTENDTIGGTVAAARNVIAGASGPGVEVVNNANFPSAIGDLIAGNYIGVDATGAAPLGNLNDGMIVTNAVATTIGGTAAGAGNVISGNGGNGIALAGTTGTLIEGNRIGTDATGTKALGNAAQGILVTGGSQGDTIGGTAAGAGNVISGNGFTGSGGPFDGLALENTGTLGELVEGNRIGTDITGNAAIANARDGILVSNAANDTIGGTAAGAGNVISGNGPTPNTAFESGITVIGVGASGTLIEGNRIGTNAAGTAKLGNGFFGIALSNAPLTTIGGTVAGAGNTISGNDEGGIVVDQPGSSGTLIEGNLIGTDATGAVALGNSGIAGVFLSASGPTTLGGTTAAARNVIAGNAADGVDIFNAGATGNVVEGNYIGLNAAGNAALPNTGNGVTVDNPDNTIGGTTAGTGNVISGNGGQGVLITSTNATGGPVTGVLVAGNLIGTDPAGASALGNGGDGVNTFDVNGDTIGGTVAGAGNTISGNGADGIGLIGSSGFLIAGNVLGLNATAGAPLGNAHSGISLFADAVGGNGSPNNTIRGNIIGGNGSAGFAGVDISGAGTSGNLLAGDLIGTNASNAAGLGNPGGGVAIFAGATANTIGGTTAADADVISGNTGVGVAISGAGTSGNVVEGDFVGTNSTGTAALANTQDGVALFGGATGNTIGGSLAAARNILSGNGFSGMTASGAGTSGNLIQGNFIGTDVNGTTAIPNALDGVGAFGGAASNTISGNLISGNTLDGISISDAGSNGFDIVSNTIGANVSGSVALANRTGILLLNSASGETIQGNLISGNNQVGINASNGSGDLISGNTIGTNAAGTIALGNAFQGIFLGDVSASTIGGTTTGARNLVSGNGINGIVIVGGGSTGDMIQGNDVGTDINGTTAIPNGAAGVYLGSGTGFNPPYAGSASGVRVSNNLISGNSGNGVIITGVGASGNVVGGNTIGTDFGGTAAVANLKDGVLIRLGATDNTIGGAGGLIAGNNGDGVAITDAGTSGNLVVGLFIGTNGDGAGPLANVGDGVHILGGATANTIGGASDFGPTILSGNGGDGVAIEGVGTSANVVVNSYIGTDSTGTVRIGNALAGVSLFNGATGNTIGGTAAGARDVISGGQSDGVDISDAGTSGNLVAGDYVGVDSSGTVALGNAGEGLAIQTGATANTIGGATAAAAVVVAANGLDGVAIDGPGTSANVVAGDVIGLDATGAAKLANSGNGVRIANGAAGNTIGGAAAGAGDTIAGNGFAGVELVGTTQGPAPSANVVQGGFIGTNAAGATGLGNTQAGIIVTESPSNTISGAVVSGNGSDGIELLGGGASLNLVAGNLIGVDPTGAKALANGGDGINIGLGAQSLGATQNTIGGTTAADRNVISGNAKDGAFIQGDSNLAEGNFVGTDVTGSVALPNAQVGIVASANNLTIGGTAAGARNLISGNAQAGVSVLGAGDVIQGNAIGTDAAGTAALANRANGIIVFTAARATIGGTVAGAGNLVSGNVGGGIALAGVSTVNTLIVGNMIGTDATGTKAIANSGDGISDQQASGTVILENLIAGNTGNGINVFLMAGGIQIAGNRIGTDVAATAAVPNLLNGVLINFSAATIGGTAAGAGNIIGGNEGDGVQINSGQSCLLQGNFIGTDLSATAPLGNALDGVAIINNARGNTVGGAAGNTIAFNGGNGVTVGSSPTDNGSVNDEILTNAIYGNGKIGIDLGDDGVTPNDSKGHNGPNFFQDFPVISAASISAAGAITIAGTLPNAAGGSPYMLQFFADAGNPTGFGEGRVFLGQAVITPAGAGAAPFSATFAVAVPSGFIVSATATDAGGNTSEFSLDVTPTRSTVSFIVVNTNDSGPGSLRQAIENVDADPGNFHVVTFNIPGTGPFTVEPITPLPAIAAATTIDATSEPGYTGMPLVAISGNQAHAAGGGTVDGLTIASGGVAVLGLTIDSFSGSGVVVRRLAAASLPAGVGARAFLQPQSGVNPNGDLLELDKFIGNGVDGVFVDGAPNVTVGGATPIGGQVIAANGGNGVEVQSASGAVVVGQIIGEISPGGPSAGNVADGVFLNNAPDSLIGSPIAGLGNVIVNNLGVGVQVAGNSSGSVVTGNVIGTDLLGKSGLGNVLGGIYINNAASNTVGGAATGAGNVISGNGFGASANAAVVLDGAGASGNVIEGDLIGLDPTGMVALANAASGVFLNDAPNNTIGGTAAGARDVISGNGTAGVQVVGAGASGNVIAGDLIGLNALGTKAVANALGGVVLDGAPHNIVGGTSLAARNVISGNGSVGVRLQGTTASGNLIQGNLVGTDPAGTTAVPNAAGGVFLSDAPANVIGGIGAGGNVLSGNGGDGVQIFGASASGNQVLGNKIGVDINGEAKLGNASAGVFLNGAPSNLVGWIMPGAGNVISGNGTGGTIAGVTIQGPTASGNAIQGNVIGADAMGRASIGNTGGGVFIDAAPQNLVGGTVAGASNLISGNGAVGVQVFDTGASGNLIQGDIIGLAAGGLAALGNAAGGVFLDNAPGNAVGGPIPAARNVISANGGYGVQVFGAGASGNYIAGNFIGTDLFGTPNAFPNASGTILLNDALNNVVTGNTAFTPVPPMSIDGPVVTQLSTTLSANRRTVTSIAVTFNTGLDATRAVTTTNYRLYAPGPNGTFGTFANIPLMIRTVRYDAGTFTVTVVPSQPLSASTTYQLVLNGQPGGLADPSGRLIDGDRDGLPGGDAILMLTPAGTQTVVGSPNARNRNAAVHPAAVDALLASGQLGGRRQR